LYRNGFSALFSGRQKRLYHRCRVSTGIEVLAVNVSMLTDDLTFSFLPSPDASSYILSIEEIGISGQTGK